MAKYPTPGGELLTLSQVRSQERMICDDCDYAVVEDEFIPCEDCPASYCLYCWEGWGWVCKNCSNLHAAMQPQAAQETVSDGYTLEDAICDLNFGDEIELE